MIRNLSAAKPFAARLFVVLGLLLVGVPAWAQMELSLYGALKSTASGPVSGDDPSGAGSFSLSPLWDEGGARANLGIRLTWWAESGLGLGLDFAQSGHEAAPASLGGSGISRLEFAGTSSVLTVNAYRRWQTGSGLSPYLGAGIGLSLPDVRYESASGAASGKGNPGPALQWVAGASYLLSERLSIFGEYKGRITGNEAHLDTGASLAGRLQDDSLNVGISLGF